MTGYFFLGLTCLIVIGFTFFNLPKPRLSGDGAMGYGLGLAFFGLAVTISSMILTIYVGWKGGFDWVSESGIRNFVVGIGWLCMAIATFACGAFKWEWHQGEFPIFLHWLAKSNGQTWIPLLMLVPYFFLLNSEMRAIVSPNVYKMPLIFGFALTFIMSLAILFGWLGASAKQQTALIEQRIDDDKRLYNDHLKFIAEHKPTDGRID
jgi:hypothetical protein